MSILAGYKTIIVSVVSILVSVLELMGIDVLPQMTPDMAWTQIQLGLTAIFMRMGMQGK
jgi:hypothetical protein